jgi:hypothetical protein
MSSIDNRIKDHKRAFPNPNNLLLLLARALQDLFTCLDLLKTTFTEMTIGVTKFQCYYLELYGCLENILSHGFECTMLGLCAWQKSHLLPYQISLGAHFCQLTTLHWGT